MDGGDIVHTKDTKLEKTRVVVAGGWDSCDTWHEFCANYMLAACHWTYLGHFLCNLPRSSYFLIQGFAFLNFNLTRPNFFNKVE